MVLSIFHYLTGLCAIAVGLAAALRGFLLVAQLFVGLGQYSFLTRGGGFAIPRGPGLQDPAQADSADATVGLVA
jgi:hypothetical protein